MSTGTLKAMFKHRKEILAAAKALGTRQEGEFLIVNGLELGLAGRLSVTCRVDQEIARALEAQDPEHHAAAIRLARQRMMEGRALQLMPIAEISQPNTWFNEGITEMLDVNFNYQTQHQNQYFLIGNLDVTPAVGWTSGTGGTKIRTTFGEFTAYTASGSAVNRQVWAQDAAAALAIKNDAVGATIVCTGSGTIRGACLMTSQAKDGSSDNTGFAWAGSRTATDLPAADTYEFTFKHELSGAAA